jgi:hypothetical protein
MQTTQLTLCKLWKLFRFPEAVARECAQNTGGAPAPVGGCFQPLGTLRRGWIPGAFYPIILEKLILKKMKFCRRFC